MRERQRERNRQRERERENERETQREKHRQTDRQTDSESLSGTETGLAQVSISRRLRVSWRRLTVTSKVGSSTSASTLKNTPI